MNLLINKNIQKMVYLKPEIRLNEEPIKRILKIIKNRLRVGTIGYTLEGRLVFLAFLAQHIA